MRVIIADDEMAVRSALKFLLEQQAGVHVVGEAGDGGNLLALAGVLQPDLILLDWELPGDPIEKLVFSLRQENEKATIMALSGRPEARRTALRAGADGFVSKGDPPEAVLAALLVAGANRMP